MKLTVWIPQNIILRILHQAAVMHKEHIQMHQLYKWPPTYWHGMQYCLWLQHNIKVGTIETQRAQPHSTANSRPEKPDMLHSP